MPDTQKCDSDTQTCSNIFGQPLSIFGMPVDKETIFANHKGQYKSRVEKRQRKLIVKTSHIKFFLHDNERIRCLTTAYSPISILEQALTGLAFLVFKRALLVFTDQRMLHIPRHTNHNRASSISQIMFEDCAKIGLKGRQLIVLYKNGYTESFPYIGRKEKKKIKALLTQLPLQPKEAGNLKGRVYLCPSCTNVLKCGESTCQTCKLEFKSSLKARLLAVLLPGGGYFHTRHVMAGLLSGMIESSAMGFLIYRWVAYYQGQGIRLLMLAALTGALIIEKIITVYHAGLITSEYIPKLKKFARRKMQRPEVVKS